MAIMAVRPPNRGNGCYTSPWLIWERMRKSTVGDVTIHNA